MCSVYGKIQKVIGETYGFRGEIGADLSDEGKVNSGYE